MMSPGAGGLTGSMHVLIAEVIMIAFALGVGFMLFAHLRLIFKNETTIEESRSRVSYDLGRHANFLAVFGSRRLLWLLPLRSELPDGDGTRFRTVTVHGDDAETVALRSAEV
jgi:palmitoyltransferase